MKGRKTKMKMKVWSESDRASWKKNEKKTKEEE